MKTNNKYWKPVTISGFTGILMGAGSMHVAQSVAQATSVSDEESMTAVRPLDNMSFREAFDTARAEMGPGGVFSWHGNLYNTYTADEWQAMSDDAKEQFAEDIAPEISLEDIDTNEIVAAEQVEEKVEVTVESPKEPEMASVSEQSVESGDDDVRVVGFGEVQLNNGQNVTVQELDVNGQRVAVIDLDQDGVADIAMTDLNHNQQMDEGEVIDLHTGEALSFTNDEVSVDDVPIDTFGA